MGKLSWSQEENLSDGAMQERVGCTKGGDHNAYDCD